MLMNLRITSLISFVSLALIHPVFLYSTETENEFLKRCPPFPCGKFGEISFPFSNRTEDLTCGLFLVDGCDDEQQWIKLTTEPQKRYKVENISKNHDDRWNITITDTHLQKLLNSRSCEAFNNSLSDFNVHTSIYEIMHSDSINLLKCNPTHTVPSPYFDFEYRECPNFTIYYNHKNIGSPQPGPPPPDCAIVNLPVNLYNSYDKIFELLTATFSFQVPISRDCNSCGVGEAICQFNNKEFKCSRGTKKEWQWKLGVGMGLGCTVILAGLILIFFRHQNQKKHASSSFHRANTYSAAFSKSDLEGANMFFGVPIFSCIELEQATNNFAPENELGDGGFGTVYFGKIKDGREVAVKRLYEHNYRKVKQFLNEIEILTRLRHKNLVSLYGCTSRRSRELLLVYEYIPNGTVADHLHGDRANSSLVTWPIRMRIAIETASALVYLHASGIVHRDVKTNNILLDNNFCVKVADFGISRLFPFDVTHISTAPQGTPGYVDPEYYQCYQLTEKSDVYSFGVVLIELISSMPAVDITRHRHEINLANLAINKIQSCAFDDLIDPFLGHQSNSDVKRSTTSVAELAFLCLQQDKEMRPTMDEVLEELKRIGRSEIELQDIEEELDHA